VIANTNVLSDEKRPRRRVSHATRHASRKFHRCPLQNTVGKEIVNPEEWENWNGDSRSPLEGKRLVDRALDGSETVGRSHGFVRVMDGASPWSMDKASVLPWCCRWPGAGLWG